MRRYQTKPQWRIGTPKKPNPKFQRIHHRTETKGMRFGCYELKEHLWTATN
ncbi:hypothetical protein HanIR_Chr13g0637941 [Helianthus annuus]|nr:hypothetical protein HanIR_Chr13g0637941 [Helianthus annuus]